MIAATAIRIDAIPATRAAADFWRFETFGLS
jgi:predicted nucleic acid-binding protein